MMDIADRDDVHALVSEFYRRVFADDLLGPIFIEVAQLDLERHLPIMCDFWETVLFRAGLYRRNALQRHLDLSAKTPLGAEHFDRWLNLWTTNVDEHYVGEKAELAKVQASRMAGAIQRRVARTSATSTAPVMPRPSR